MTRVSIVLLLFLCISCSPKNGKVTDVVVAKVYDKYLYLSQLNVIIPSGLSETDSANLVKDHIDKWIRKELLVYQAEQYLSLEEKNVEQQIEDYRSSLLIFKYEQNYVIQKLDTSINRHAVEEYYTNNSSNFILNSPLVKGLFIQVPLNAPDLDKVKRWYKSDKVEDLKSLESYCFNNATRYDYFDERWTYFNEFYRILPETYIRPENILIGRKNYEAVDSNYHYFLKISDYRLASTVAPIEFVMADIQSILLNKRKIQMIDELESNIYNDALNHDKFTIY